MQIFNIHIHPTTWWSAALQGPLHVVPPPPDAGLRTHAPPPSARCRDHASLQRGVHELRELVGAFEACSQKAVESLIEQAAVKC